MTDITDKYEKFKVPYSTNEKHSSDEFDPKENGGLDNPANRHNDKVLDDICDTHPGSPMCKVFDCWSESVDQAGIEKVLRVGQWKRSSHSQPATSSILRFQWGIHNLNVHSFFQAMILFEVIHD